MINLAFGQIPKLINLAFVHCPKEFHTETVIYAGGPIPNQSTNQLNQCLFTKYSASLRYIQHRFQPKMQKPSRKIKILKTS